MHAVNTCRVGLATWATFFLLMAAQATAQPYEYVWDGEADLFWDVDMNWNVGNSGQVNNVVPLAVFAEFALIDNGDTVTVRNAQTEFNTSNTSGAPGGVNVANGSGLVINGTGHLAILEQSADIGGGATFLTSGDLNINGGDSGGSNVTVRTGGQLTAEDDIDVNDGSLVMETGTTVIAQNINSGAAGSISLDGNASVTSFGSTTLSGTTTIAGPDVTFSSQRVVLADTTIFTPVITHASNHSVIDVSQSVTMNGTLRPQFDSVTPNLGDTWTLWDAGSNLGMFDSSDDSLTPLAPGLRYAVISTPTGSTNGELGVLTVENFLTAEVDRATGEVSIRNTGSDGAGVTISGYQISTAAGTIAPSNFSGFEDSGFDGGQWTEAAVAPDTVAELNASADSLIAISTTHSLGQIYDPISGLQQFGDPVPEDFEFTYHTDEGRTVTGEANYINEGISNTLVLQVDPTDGKVRIINDSTFDGVEIDGYRVLSASGSLSTAWNSLADQGVDDWAEAGPSANVLSELNPLGTLIVNAGEIVAEMTGVYDVGGTPMQDLTFEFRAASLTGSPIGDYNENGVVDAADYTIWRDLLGQSVDLPNEDPDTTSGEVTQEDYEVWKANFGNTGRLGAFAVFDGVVRYSTFSLSAAGALVSSTVPEPSSLVLLGLSVLISGCRQRMWRRFSIHLV